MTTKNVITRRDFLKGAAGAFIATAVGSPFTGPAAAEPTSTVILVRDARVLDGAGRIDQKVLQSMLDEAVKGLAGAVDTQAAWQSFFRKGDVVGIKTNAWYKLPTPPELEEAIRQRLLQVGIPQKNLAIDDRGVLDNPVFANATALVNARPLRTHHWSGVGTCLKNYIMFVRSPYLYHGEGCSDLGKIWTMPLVKGKTRLNVLVALTPQFYGRGAHFFDKRYVWPYKGLIVGTDVVAVDAVGAELLRRKRLSHFGEDRALDVPPVHITAAETRYGLGVSDLKRIRIVRVGWQEDALV